MTTPLAGNGCIAGPSAGTRTRTGRWITDRYFPHGQGEPWRFTDPATGRQLLRVQEAVKPQRYLKVKGEANPFDPAWATYFQDRDGKLALQASAPFRARILRQQDGRCPGCRQVIQVDEEVDLHHRDGQHQNTQWGNLVLFHPNCHRQEHYVPDTPMRRALHRHLVYNQAGGEQCCEQSRR